MNGGKMPMEVNNILCIRHEQAEHWCLYSHLWCSLPVFVTQDDRESRSALYKDGTSLIILGGDLARSGNQKFIYNRLWHEVAHLYFKDVWKPWELSYEYRADLVASAATGREITLSRLYDVKSSSRASESIQLIDKRIEHLCHTGSKYSKADVLHMLQCLKPVTVLRSVRGNQYI
jgi:hypothetical protein